MGTRYKVGDRVEVLGKRKVGSRLKPFSRGVGLISEIRHDGYYASERTVYIVQLPDRKRICWASELKLIRRG